jgi:4-hydroxy-2-oxoheptanedioate aldolase
LLDDGLMGIIVPLVNTKAEAEAAARAVRYPPVGARSAAGSFITSLYGDDYAAEVDSEVFLAVQIESHQAVENAEEILAVEGVDGCWVGPADLALSMGLEAAEAGINPAHNEAVAHVLNACQTTGKIPGYACGSMEMGERRITEGFKFVNVGGDSTFVAEGAARYLSKLR